MKQKPIINVADAPVHNGSSGEHFEYSMTELAGCLGAQAIGANVTRVPPGKAAFPFHHHHANEEHFFILDGHGVLRVGSGVYEVKRHDYIVDLPGGADAAHQLINTGNEDLVYLAISTMQRPEVVGYPDARKTGVRTSQADGADSRFLITDSARNAVGYWDGEDGREVARILATRRSG